MSHSYCAHGIDVENYHCAFCPPSNVDHLLTVLTDHLATLESCGFGGEGEINGGDAVDAINDHFAQLRDALGDVVGNRPQHGDPLGGFAP
jgi:hypothetical protein